MSLGCKTNKLNTKDKSRFGIELILNLYGCNPRTITSKKRLQGYVNKLCKIIKMKKYGRTWIPYFGHKEIHTKGYSLVQLIETSSITGHFSEYKDSAYINIFSCKRFDARKAKSFSKQYFEAKRIVSELINRD